MKLVVGLGNPGEKYKNTRHNVGFLIVENFCNFKNITNVKNAFESIVYSFQKNQETFLFIFPQTYMNLSGRAVTQIKKFYKCEIEDILVIYDEANISAGEYKISVDSGSGGHNGIKNIVQELGTQNFLKLRVGISGNTKLEQIIGDYVLGNFLNQEMLLIKNLYPEFNKIIDDFLDGKNSSQLMNIYNQKK